MSALQSGAMDRGTVEFLIGVGVATAYWLVPRDKAIACAQHIRRPRPRIVTITAYAPDGSTASTEITILPLKRRPSQVL